MPIQSPFLDACRGVAHDRLPVWFMRQAGRSLPEYRQLRTSGSILAAIAQPEIAAEITLQPVRRHGVDAAILYSDIVVPVHAIGFGVDIQPGVGPVVEQPFRSAADLERLRDYQPDVDAPYVGETCRILSRELDVPLIGFAGAPFTVASYLIEGRPSRTYGLTKTMMRADEPLWFALLDRLADIAIASLRSQVANGARAVQLFDSWAGALHPDDYRQYVASASTKVFKGIADLNVPCLHFGVNTSELLDQMAAAGADVVGVDWRTSLAHARRAVGPTVGLQGNLDPTAILGGWDITRQCAEAVLAAIDEPTRHIFNLGHGVLPETDAGVLTELVGWLHTIHLDRLGQPNTDTPASEANTTAPHREPA
jgi:uroporphyrinogen decarboxylase